MLRSLRRRNELRDVVLLHSARNEDDVIFGGELRHIERLRVADSVLSRSVQDGPGTGRRVRLAKGRAGERWLVWRRPAEALPRIECDVVVISAGGQEDRALTVALCHLETEHTGIKRERALQVSDP